MSALFQLTRNAHRGFSGGVHAVSMCISLRSPLTPKYLSLPALRPSKQQHLRENRALEPLGSCPLRGVPPGPGSKPGISLHAPGPGPQRASAPRGLLTSAGPSVPGQGESSGAGAGEAAG